MPLQATSGAASYDAFGGGVAAVPNYIEDVFSTWLYTGNGTTQTINNGIDLAGKGGMVWGKTRDAVVAHTITDTVRGVDKEIFPNLTDAQQTRATGTGSVFAFNSNGFSTSGVNGFINYSGLLEVAWTFREQPKFFDVVTYTGDGTANRNISHNLGSAPGCIIVKQTAGSNAGLRSWYVYHRSLGATQTIFLNLTNAAQTDSPWGNTEPTSTQFTVNGDNNVNGGTYVAYLFAHNAGGFGLTGTDNVISCGSYAGSGAAQEINLGYEPQWVLVKNITTAGWDWYVIDNMRGFVVNPASPIFTKSLSPNTSGAESDQTAISPTATGFRLNSGAGAFNGSSNTYIYIAIRRGPMKVPTTGTSVFAPLAVNNATGTVNTTGFPVDLQMQFYRPGGISPGTSQWIDRLRGFSSTSTDSGTRLYTTGSQAEAATAIGTLFNNTGFSTGASWASASMSYNNFGRAPSFFDEVCYAGTGATNTAVPHNLTVTPELAIFKNRTTAGYNWVVKTTATFGTNNYLILEGPNSLLTNTSYGATASASQITLSTGGGNAGDWNRSGDTYVAYLFASCPGVSKVGSYTGTGATQTINCGFTGGARFVLIKRTDSTGDWYVWDSARGIVAGNDPYLLLNSTAAEVTSTDYVDTAATGFELSNTAPAALNASGGSYIFLAVA